MNGRTRGPFGDAAQDTDVNRDSWPPEEWDALPPPPTHEFGTVVSSSLVRLGEYELLEEVARGGMGVVYRARQSSLDRIVAVKMIRDSVLAGPEDVARFHSEASAAARLQHPNIVPIHEVGQWAGQHFFSMGFISGRSLAEVARENQLAPRSAAALVKTIAAAVQSAHDQGILHRDIKPSNVLIDHQGQPHVTDFGLAKRLEGDRQLTGSEQILGTPAYMPPEQARGDHRQIGFASDVYALGAVLYELLAGRPPFRGESPLVTIRQVLEDEPVSPRRLNPDVSRDLETICLKCLQKEPGLRYPTTQALVDELARYLDGRPIQARPLGVAWRGWRWCRRNPALALALVLLFMLAGGGPAVAIYTSELLRRATLAENDRLAAQIQFLRSAAPDAVPGIIDELNRRREEVVPQLVTLWKDPSLPDVERTRLSLFLYREGAAYADFAYQRLLVASPQEFSMLRTALAKDDGPLVEELWRETTVAGKSPTLLRSAAALALYNPDDPRWQQLAPRVAEALVQENSLHAAVWAEQFEPVKQRLIPPLRASFADTSVERAAQRTLATDFLSKYAADDLLLLVELVAGADERQFHALFEVLVTHGEAAMQLVERTLDESLAVRPVDWEDDTPEQQSANLAIALMRLGNPQRLWPLLKHSHDPTLRTRLIDRLLSRGAAAEELAARLGVESDVSTRRALILALGEAPDQRIPLALREKVVARLTECCRTDPDPGVYAAAEWTLRRWGGEELVQAIRKDSLSGDPSSPLGRFITSEGQVMIVIPGPVEFDMGAPQSETQRFASGGEAVRRVRIERSFAVSLYELTREQYLKFEQDPPIVEERKGQNIWHNENWSRSYGPDPQCPHIALPFTVAARYCRWLSEQDGLPEHELCYPICKSTGASMTFPDNYLERTGYRMPTAAEWEYVCRAGADTIRFFGRSSALLHKYAWYNLQSQQRSWPVGMLKPNDLGLFDVYGNVRELCMNRKGFRHTVGANGIALDVEESDLTIGHQSFMQTCGGSYIEQPRFIRSASRETGQEAQAGSNLNGVRLVRTVKLDE